MGYHTCGRCGVVQDDDESDCPVCGNDSYYTSTFPPVEEPEPPEEPDDEPEAEETESEDDEEGHVCPECGESFETVQGLAGHSQVHKGDDEDDGEEDGPGNSE